MLLMIDNYDSFTYNLVQYFRELGQEVRIERNDAISVDKALALKPKHIVISPGPCSPDQAGVSMALIKEAAGKVPVLGVCLGHQSIAQAFGGHIVHAHQVMHGKTSMVQHQFCGVFRGIPSPFEATRYHSLVVDPKHIPECLEVTAWSEASASGGPAEIMGLRHKVHAIEGIQFHPEAILTDYGHDLLRNFLTA